MIKHSDYYYDTDRNKDLKQIAEKKLLESLMSMSLQIEKIKNKKIKNIFRKEISSQIKEKIKNINYWLTIIEDRGEIKTNTRDLRHYNNKNKK